MVHKPQLPKQFVLVAADVSASMIVDYQHRGLLGIISLSGSDNSHAAILANALNIPAIMGIEYLAIRQLNQKEVILNGYSCPLHVEPNEVLINEYRHILLAEIALEKQVKKVADLPTVTLDDYKVTLLVNSGLSSGFESSHHVLSLLIMLMLRALVFIALKLLL